MARRSRGRIKEILAVFLGHDAECLKYFKEEIEEELGGKHWCAVCHDDSPGFDDIQENDKCVVCQAIDVCKLCTYRFDAATLLPGEKPPRNCITSFQLGTGIPVRTGDKVCLLCGLFTSDPQLSRKHLIMNKGTSAMDVIFNMNRSDTSNCLKTLVLAGWILAGTRRRSGQWTNAFMIRISYFLSFAEEAKLKQAMSLRKNHVAILGSTMGRNANFLSHGVGEVAMSATRSSLMGMLF